MIALAENIVLHLTSGRPAKAISLAVLLPVSMMLWFCHEPAAAQPTRTLPDGTPLPPLRGELPEADTQAPAAAAGETDAAVSRPPIPDPPPAALPPPRIPRPPKPSLAWRARAFAAAAAPAAGQPGSRFRRTAFEAGSEDVLGAITSACGAAGFVVSAAASGAGDLLVKRPDPSSQAGDGIIFAVRDRGNGISSVTCVPESKSANLDAPMVDAIVKQVDALLSRRGSL